MAASPFCLTGTANGLFSPVSCDIGMQGNPMSYGMAGDAAPLEIKMRCRAGGCAANARCSACSGPVFSAATAQGRDPPTFRILRKEVSSGLSRIAAQRLG